jgi:hypothetical protein
MDWQTTATIIGGIVSATTLIGVFIKKVLPGIRKANHFVDDMVGEEARPGVPARPGIVETLAEVQSELAKVKEQVQNSHLTNLRDDVDEVIGKVDGLHDKMDDHLRNCPPVTTVNINGGITP